MVVSNFVSKIGIIIQQNWVIKKMDTAMGIESVKLVSKSQSDGINFINSPTAKVLNASDILLRRLLNAW